VSTLKAKARLSNIKIYENHAVNISAKLNCSTGVFCCLASVQVCLIFFCDGMLTAICYQLILLLNWRNTSLNC